MHNCEWCGNEMEPKTQPGGYSKKYCRKSCKQRAYEARKYGAYNAIREALEKFPRSCPECGEPLDPSIMSGSYACTADHTIPVSKGGAHHLENILIIHKGCNSSKQDIIDGDVTSTS